MIALLEVFTVCGVTLAIGAAAEYTNVGEYFARFLGLPHELENQR